MLDLNKILIDGAWTALAFSVLIVGTVIYNKRLILNPGDIPADILAAVPPKTEQERRLSAWLGLPLILVMLGLPAYSAYTFGQQQPDAGFLALFGHVFLVGMIVNLVDLVILDWLIFCTITPSIFVYSGTEGFAGYKDYAFHLRMHAKAFPALLIVMAVLAGVVYLLL